MLKKTFILLLVFCCASSLYIKSYGQNLKQLEKNYKKEVRQGNNLQAAKIAIQIADNYLGLPQGQRDYRKIIDYYKNAISQSQIAGDNNLEAESYLKLAKHYGNYEETIKESVRDYNRGIAIVERQGNWNTYVKSTKELSNVYAREGTFGKAISVLQRSMTAAEKHDISIDEKSYYRQFVAIYRKAGDERGEKQYLARLNGTSTPSKKNNVTPTPNSTDSELLGLEIELEEARKREESLNSRLISLQASSTQNKDSINNLLLQLEAAEENRLLLEENKKQTQENLEKQQEITQLLIGLAIMGGIFIVIVAFALLASKRANKRLAAKNTEILNQKQEIESQKHEIEQQSKKLENEQEKSEKLLLNILPKATAEELKEKGFASPKSYDMVTVLFTDFKGFTTIAEQLTPVEIVRELDICFLKFDDIVAKYNMEKIKTIGDAYMCAGGVPLENTTNPIDAVKAGLEMQEFMLHRKEEKLKRGETPFELRLGIHTGHVVAGVVGKKKFAYDIWGDAVNIAARMESSSEVGRVNISEVTYEYIKDSFYCNYRGKIQAKNKGEIDMYFVNGPI